MVVTFQETSSPLIDQEIVFSFALGQVDVMGWLCAHALVILITPMVLAQFVTLVEVAIIFGSMGKGSASWKKHTELVCCDDHGGIVHCTWHSKVTLPKGWRKAGHPMWIKHAGNLEDDVDSGTSAHHAVPISYSKANALRLLRDLSTGKKEVIEFQVKAGDSMELLD